MKKLALIFVILFFSGLSTATVATYTGETVKQGPETEFMIGLASDQNLNTEIEVDEVEGLSISYNSSYMFDPSDSDKVFQSGGQQYSLKELNINVQSQNVSRERYDIPVTFRAYSNQSSEGTRPRVIHEREYTFSFVTDLSPDFGLNGSLISDEETDPAERDEPDERLNVTPDKENTLTDRNQTDPQGEENETGPGTTTFLLIGGILALTLYIIREAFT